VSARSSRRTDLFLALVFASVTAAIVWSLFMEPRLTQRSKQRQVARSGVIATDGDPTLGTTDAPVALVVYSDFQCPACWKFAREALPRLYSEYVVSGQLRIVFKHRPLEAIHPVAQRVAEAAECANRQQAFWKMHDGLFALRGVIDREAVMRLAGEIQLQIPSFERCVDERHGLRTVQKHIDDAAGRGIDATPTLVFGVPAENGAVMPTIVHSGFTDYVSIQKELTNQRDAGHRR